MPIIYNFVNPKVSIEFNIEFNSSSFYNNFIFNLYQIYELNNWLLNPKNNFTLKHLLVGTVKLIRNASKINLFTMIVEVLME